MSFLEKMTVDLLDGPISTSITLPGSKSQSLRHLVLSSLAVGDSTINNLGECDDVHRMIAALEAIGVAIHLVNGGKTARVRGTGGHFINEKATQNVGLSATTARFLLALAAIRPGLTEIDGESSMRKRPNADLIRSLQELGAQIVEGAEGYLPIRIRGTRDLKNGISISGRISSQYLSALLQIAPMVHGGLRICVQGELVSRPYLDLTLDAMRSHGVTVTFRDGNVFEVEQQVYSATEVEIEGDASAASYHCALAMLHGGSVHLRNLTHRTRQGDFKFVQICELLGASVRATDSGTVLTVPARVPLKRCPAAISMASMPDVAPTLMAIAPFVPGGLYITGLSTLRVKECDRIAVPANQLRKLGVGVEEGPDWIRIQETAIERFNRGVIISTHDDHRIAMSFGVLATKIGGTSIEDPNCVRKTYPDFWNELNRLSIKPA